MAKTNFIDGWYAKHQSGQIRFDPDMLVIRSLRSKSEVLEWGTLFYSQAREEYKSTVVSDGGRASFDLDLMAELELGRFDSLIVAANPNSLFPGHLVIYPAERSETLSAENIREILELSGETPEFTFIHNMRRSAASVLDWAHYQAYPLIFPIDQDQKVEVGSSGNVSLYRSSLDSPADALIIEGSDPGSAAELIYGLAVACLSGSVDAEAEAAFNLICRNGMTWFIPRSVKQSDRASRYFGGLEMGGLFCLPNADEFRRYLPDNLREEIENASLRTTTNGILPFIDIARKLLSDQI